MHIDLFMMVLCDESAYPRRRGNSAVDLFIAAVLVGADVDQVAILLVRGIQALDFTRLCKLPGIDNAGHQAADRCVYIDRGEQARIRHFTRQHNVSVEDGARGIRHRIIEVAALNQHGIDRGNRAVNAVPRALHQRRQQREHRRRIALRHRWFSHRQADLALRLRHAGQRIHQ